MKNKYPNIKKHLVTCTNSNELTVKKAYGCTFIDDEGNSFLNVNDISCVLGYNNPSFTTKVSEAVLNKNIAHLSNYSNDKEVLIKRLMKLTDNNFDKVFFASSGGEVVDWSIKLARRATGKDNIISFNDALHGRSFAGAFLSGTPLRKEGFGTGLENIYFWDFPKPNQVKYNKANEYKDIAGIIIEPLQALGGMIFPSKKYFKWLREYCDQNNIVLIFDEIQTGFGKTGTMFAYEQTGIVPDILLMGKGMSNGFGLGGLLMNKKVSEKIKPQEMSGGSADNDLMCSIVNIVLDEFEKQDILNNVKKSGTLLKKGLNKLIEDKVLDGDLNGKGLFLSLKSKDAEEIVKEAKDKGVLLGLKGENVLFRPPLVINKEEINKVLDALKF